MVPGGGQLLSAVKKRGIKELGIEPDPSEYAFITKRGLNCLRAFVNPEHPGTHVEEAIRTADVVSMMEVLEHMEQPQKMMAFLRATMRSGAYFVVEVPRHPSVATYANLVYKDIIYRHIVVAQHLQIFNEETFRYLFGNAFEIIGEWGFGQGFTDLVKFPLIHEGRTGAEDSALYQAIMSHSNEIQRIFDSSGLADSMLLVARRS